MIRNYFLLNLLLIIIIGLLGNKFFHVLKYSEAIPVETGRGEVLEEDIADVHKDKPFNETLFEVIASQDLFRPSRTAPLIEKKDAEKPPLPNPPKLFGTIILNDNKTAILEQSDTKTTKVYRINDTISGYTLLEIHENKVVLLGNEERVEVKLRDDKGIQPPSRTVIRPQSLQQTNQSGRQIGSPGATPQRRARPVPPRRRPTRIVPPAPPEIPQSPQTPEMPEAHETENDPAQEEDQ